MKLYTISDVHISRSQARRVLAGLDKFKIVLFDFDKVPMVGQAFVDEIFCVFRAKNPQIKLEIMNANESVKFMIDRVELLFADSKIKFIFVNRLRILIYWLQKGKKSCFCAAII